MLVARDESGPEPVPLGFVDLRNLFTKNILRQKLDGGGAWVGGLREEMRLRMWVCDFSQVFFLRCFFSGVFSQVFFLRCFFSGVFSQVFFLRCRKRECVRAFGKGHRRNGLRLVMPQGPGSRLS